MDWPFSRCAGWIVVARTWTGSPWRKKGPGLRDENVHSTSSRTRTAIVYFVWLTVQSQVFNRNLGILHNVPYMILYQHLCEWPLLLWSFCMRFRQTCCSSHPLRVHSCEENGRNRSYDDVVIEQIGHVNGEPPSPFGFTCPSRCFIQLRLDSGRKQISFVYNLIDLETYI